MAGDDDNTSNSNGRILSSAEFTVGYWQHCILWTGIVSTFARESELTILRHENTPTRTFCQMTEMSVFGVVRSQYTCVFGYLSVEHARKGEL